MNGGMLFKEKITESLDSIQTLSDHRRIILDKPLLKAVYDSFYQRLLKGIIQKNGNYIEVGAGGFNAKDYASNVKSSEFVANPLTDLVIDATKMDIEDSSVDSFITLNTLHHMREPQKFFSEVNRTLKAGGELRLIEPNCQYWSKIFYTYFHHEPFYESDTWNLPEKDGRLTNANGMIPTMIFIRDIKLFKKLNPQLEITEISYFNFFSFILSGGLSFKSPVPLFLVKPLLKLESYLECLGKYLGIFMFIKIKKLR